MLEQNEMHHRKVPQLLLVLHSVRARSAYDVDSSAMRFTVFLRNSELY